MKPGKRVTLADVAAHAGVDRSVISRVMNSDPGLNIRPETRVRVLASVKALGYRPNAAARTLRTRRSRTIGLFVPDHADPVYAEIVTGAEAAAAERGCVLVTGSGRVADSAQPYLDLLADGRVDGLLLAGGVTATPAALRESGMPWLLLNRSMADATRHVVLDDEGAAAMAVEHLVNLGHRRIAHLAGPDGSDTASRRASGYRAAMRRHGATPDPGLAVRADYTADGGFQAMTELLGRTPRPTAVFVANVTSAIGAVRAAYRCGVRVPSELSIVAVHDLPFAEYLVPALTTVRMPLQELGRRGVEKLTTTDPDAPVSETVGAPMELVRRESTAPPREA
ncbi:LacI family DNA-binding transcriptional regulator [Cryptosporangium arvum]|uniref:Transcriptional regulator n=1 Tax=Cryptosporangium arvum DSM 44712 TaxID=927661 RepID=A0A011AEK1_9ACTN|nr:LacI family DNA-binding transcriptional regulator [Cryptosporangium arvum]EXG80466.1 transcriptional regulator [Cryptosporangium arvum DSM 44712]